jgi:solute carrier family 25 phosphate transporter 23/24/25/41
VSVDSRVVIAGAAGAATPSGIKIGKLQTFLCGGVAGCLSRTFTAPLDVTKILFQIQSEPIKGGDGAKGYTSFSGALMQIYKEEGLLGLWKGNVVACLRLGPYSAIKYFTFENTQAMFEDENGVVRPEKRALCGALAGCCAVLSTYPLDLVKTRLTVQKSGVGADGTVYKKTYNGTADCLKKVYQQEGRAGLFKGLSPTIVGVIPFEAVQFTFYAWIKEIRGKMKAENAAAAGLPESDGKLVTFDFLVLGCISGAVAQTAAYPFDLMRKRFMAQSNAPGMLKTQYSGIFQCLQQIVKEEGPLGLYKGTVPNLLKVCPYAAIMWAAYENARYAFEWANYNGYNPSYTGIKATD